ncbi:J domain-containing protein [Paraburkholderia fungorum]|uniref:J domain-containing protein n=1 Tax=Paraburkholderia fungorum TaxID=134537 RepID=UPI0038B6E949
MATLYDTLGVHAHATDEEIKRAYRKAAMKWHPDRNSGAEEVARATFQEIKDAYAILSDATQRKVYDAVYSEQMRGWEAQRTRQQKAQAEREAAARAADEAAYAEMVSLAMRFADDGHNRDVLFGVLLGRRCEARRAAQIADSVSALQASRRAAEKAEVAAEAVAKAADVPDVSARTEAATVNGDAANLGTPGNHGNPGKREENASDAHPAGVLSGLWFQFLNGLRF